jgi:hypothetical protein
LVVPKKTLGIIIAADRLMRSALNSTVPHRACTSQKACSAVYLGLLV